MRLKQSVVEILVAAALVVAGLFAPSSGVAQDEKVKTAMELLGSMADKLGPPKIEGNGYCCRETGTYNLFRLNQDEQ
jgi:hypothetical protein